MKFSIVIPVYNVEKYIDKCLNSVLIQSYKNFEVIIVNDGSKDKSQKIIDKYVKKDNRFKSYIKENGGLSDARNYGLKYVSGDYLLFIDSDDYIEKDLLKRIYEVLKKNNYELLKFKINIVDEKGNILGKERIDNNSKDLNLVQALSLNYCEPAWTYCYNYNFWKNNKFKYAKGKIHEDFGLTPLIIASANSIGLLNYYGYNYVQRPGSIVNGAEKNIKRTEDMLFHFDYLYNKFKNLNKISSYEKKVLYSFIANALIRKGTLLSGKQLKLYIKELKKRNVFNLVLKDNISRKIKYLLLKLNPYLYIIALKKL